MIAALALLLQSPPAPAALPVAAGLPLRGVVVDAAGEAVAGADVALTSRAELDIFETLTIDRATTGSSGRFELEFTPEWLARADFRPPRLVAFEPDHGFDSIEFEFERLPVGESLRLELAGAASGSIQLTDHAGEPLSGVGVFPASLSASGREPQLPLDLWREWARPTDAEGRVSLPAPLAEVQRLGLDSERFGAMTVAAYADSSGTIAELPGILALPGSSARTADLSDLLPAGSSVDYQGSGQPMFESSQLSADFPENLPLGEDGRVTFFALPGVARLRVTSPDPTALRIPLLQVADEPNGPLAARPTAIGDEHRMEVHGRFVSAADESPVAGLRFHVESMGTAVVTTDADGRFEFETYAPLFRFVGFDLSTEFCSASLPSTFDHFRRPADGLLLELDELRLEPGVEVRGVVRDADGAPIAGALVLARQTGPRRPAPGGVLLDGTEFRLMRMSDAEGRFAFEGLSASRPVRLVARAPGLFGTQDVASPGDGREYDLEARPLLRGVGQVCDTEGRPVAGLRLALLAVDERSVPIAGSDALDASRPDTITDAQGRFDSGPRLEPEREYVAAWSSGEFAELQEGRFSGAELAAGVRLTAVPLTPAVGRLLDSSGLPLANAAVRARWGEAGAVADPEGRLRLEGIEPRGTAVLVEAQDGATWPAWIEPGEDLEWMLGPPEGPSDQERVERRALELRLAEPHLRARLAAGIESNDDFEKLEGLRGLARLHPGQALLELERLEFTQGALVDYARGAVVDALLEVSPHEALSVARSMELGMDRALKLLEVGESLAPAVEAELHLELVAELRRVEPPEYRLVSYARLADRLLDLGSDELARDLLEEAAAVADALPKVEWPAYARSVYGEVLARVDREAGLAMVESMEV